MLGNGHSRESRAKTTSDGDDLCALPTHQPNSSLDTNGAIQVNLTRDVYMKEESDTNSVLYARQ